ncbi:MAG: aminotransferase class I/II-fold pyridoxal phosphate-dependent enzyme, partial [Rhodocyclaceae bacterium]|nr:aminotransferase class I/II-fold pyridoxal phosphate-dependent enzyme [Rhodocyclaceae bacterium]
MNEHALSIDTLAVRAGTLRSEFGEHSEALYLTSSFVYATAAEAAARFAEDDAYVYSRFSNPNITMLQSRLAALEGGEAAVVTATGMSAVLALVLALLKSGDHLVASHGLFASTQQMFATWLPRFGIECDFAQPTDIESWRAAVRPNTRLFFAETPSNPCMDLVDIAAVADIAHRNSARLVIDNSFCTPVLQRPLEHGADIVMHSATKMMDGQGRVLGGALIGKRDDIDAIYKVLRTTGPA